jgi:hypothetical protein
MAAELLRELTARGVRLWVADCGGLGFDGPLTDGDLGRMRDSREGLLRLLSVPVAVPAVRDCSSLRPVVVHCRREPFDMLIDRTTEWGNPFRIGRDGDRAEVLAKYRRWVLARTDLESALPRLAGRRLGCWCAPRPCHGDVLADLVCRLFCELPLDGPGAPCPWCGRDDLTTDAPGGVRCLRCDRLAWRSVGSGVIERADL